MPAKKKDDTEEPKEAVYIVRHAMVGPTHAFLIQDDIVKESVLGHTINGPTQGSSQWYAWDIDRLVAVGAIERIDEDPNRDEARQEGPAPEAPEGKQFPAGGVPVENAAAVPVRSGSNTTDTSSQSMQTGGGNASVTPEQAAALAAQESASGDKDKK